MTSHLCIALGTRPEIIKLAPLIRRMRHHNVPFSLVHTGQHYDYNLEHVFFDELGLPLPSVQLATSAPSHGAMLAKMFEALESLWLKERPCGVVVQGDTNSAFAAGFMAQRLGISVAHIEAGLRSNDWTMPEEANRVFIDRLATRLYVPTQAQAMQLQVEGIESSRVVVTGNTIADAVEEHLPRALAKQLSGSVAKHTTAPFALLTFHRPALVEHSERLKAVLEAAQRVCHTHALHGLFLVHPRTKKAIDKLSLALPSITFEEPVGYLSMLNLLKNATLLLTDSGGLQEEAALLHTPCITVRENTERPETLLAGGNILVGFDHIALENAANFLLTEKILWKPLYSVSHPTDLILQDLRRTLCVSS